MSTYTLESQKRGGGKLRQQKTAKSIGWSVKCVQESEKERGVESKNNAEAYLWL